MAENKYYTPEPEELFIGYTCEIKNTADARLRFFPTVITKEFIGSIVRISNTGIRTKYLDKEDVESLGWVNGDLYEYYVKENSEFIYKLTNSPGNHYIIIDAIIKSKHPNFSINFPGEFFDYVEAIRYVGECKSINELKVIMKLLRIQ